MRACIVGPPIHAALPGSSRCAAHGSRSAWPKSGLNAWSYQRVRRQVLAEEKVCRACGAPGTDARPLEVDHIVPRFLVELGLVATPSGGIHARSNLRALCSTCHNVKTTAERKLGSRLAAARRKRLRRSA